MALSPRRGLAIAAALFLSCSTLGAASSASHASTASSPRVDVLDGGRVVVNLALTGDLPGLLTLNLQQQSDGSVTGEWALKVAYADHTDPATGEEPPIEEDEDHPHKDFMRLVNRGTLGGAVTAGSLSFGADGILGDLTATLTINQGSLEFEGATGTGSATLADLVLQF